MDEYTCILKEYLDGKRDINKIVYKIMGTTIRGSNNGRFTIDEAMAKVKKI